MPLYNKKDSVNYQKYADRQTCALDHDEKRRNDGLGSNRMTAKVQLLCKKKTEFIPDILEAYIPGQEPLAYDQENQKLTVLLVDIDEEILKQEIPVQEKTSKIKIENYSLLNKLPLCYHN